MLSEQTIQDHFAGWDLNEKEWRYLAMHTPRFAFLLRTVHDCLARAPGRRTGDLRVLDIGPSFQTDLLYHAFPGVTLNTLGFRNPRCYREEYVKDHLQFDLNESEFPERWPKWHQHDVVVMAEVIEHLYTNPELVLDFIKQLVKPDGYLIVQTPNAVSLMKRIVMLRGANPYEMIRKSRWNPGHFREYTLHELRGIGPRVGLSVHGWDLQNYFHPPGRLIRFFGMFRKTLRQGITIVYRRDAEQGQQAA
jgi:SAM-dependent methyltransferase